MRRAAWEWRGFGAIAGAVPSIALQAQARNDLVGVGFRVSMRSCRLGRTPSEAAPGRPKAVQADLGRLFLWERCNAGRLFFPQFARSFFVFGLEFDFVDRRVFLGRFWLDICQNRVFVLSAGQLLAVFGVLDGVGAVLSAQVGARG